MTRGQSVLLGVGLCAMAVAFALSFRLTGGGDYANPFCADRRCGDAAPAIDALQRGRLARFFDEQPAMGPVSLVARAPAAALARAPGGNEDWQYRAGSVVCALAAAALALVLALMLAARGVPWTGWLPLAALCILNPANGDALQRGHPEEILGAALLAGAALAAAARRPPLLVGLLLGLSLTTKQWAWIGVLPVLFVVGGEAWRRVAASALAVVVALTLPMAAGDLRAFRDATDAAANPPGTVKPLDIWFPLAKREVVSVRSKDGIDILTVWRIPDALDRLTHPLVALLGFGLSLAWWLRGRRGNALWLLALVMLVRVLADPLAHPYHHAPFVLALAVAEASRRPRFPWATVAASACLAVSLRLFDAGSWDTANVTYLAWAIPAAILLVVAAFGVRSGRRVAA